MRQNPIAVVLKPFVELIDLIVSVLLIGHIVALRHLREQTFGVKDQIVIFRLDLLVDEQQVDVLLVRLVQLCFRRAAGLVCRKVVASYLPDRERLPKDELVINYLCQLTKPPSDLEVLSRKRFFIIG